ncbi:MAG: NAD(P)/FAD-dependent oxidoreductase [Thiofilum sp.]|uniref:NAD(P)/FAD-dependent oxidoreductase n=1 Tax=Thiofilum sp. TaxID=2212733 RepID=UPI0025E21915|nr:NAD(P)/FAD-dependent oxidoreductase [Thiofilum sp.]MBK8453054.1 NAD(P)/FAD-dependent oxidoreductase [Thiofilum sp.]
MQHTTTPASDLHRIVIVGGGAGGLELATLLGRTVGRHNKATITLIDKNRTHIWKPKLHEIAAGSMDINLHQLDYLAQAHWNYFQYRVGEMTGLDRENRLVHLAPYVDEEGKQVTSERSFGYDTLVIAVGSRTNDFGIPGVTENAIRLDTPEQAERFHRSLVNACIRAHAQNTPLKPGQLQIAIIGAGATGVELAAELRHTMRGIIAYGLDKINPDTDVVLTIIEAGERILPALPERLAKSVTDILQKLDIKLRTSAKVVEVAPDGVKLADGAFIPAELIVWAAGVRAPVFLQRLGLEVNKINQLVVKQTLQTTQDENIFAIGDCAACPWPEQGANAWIPPRAQAANQQASHLAKQIRRRLNGQALEPWTYKDFGSLVSLGEHWAVGGLMGNLSRGTFFIDGYIARIMYNSLYKKHQLALHGFFKVALDTLSNFIRRTSRPTIKLH